MDPVTGALVAAAVAWISVLVAARLPGPRLPQRPLRKVGAATLVLLALALLGVPLHPAVPLVFLVGGVVGVYVAAPSEGGAAAA